VHLAAGSIVSNESCLADWDKAENRLDGAREGRASGRYQPVGLRPDMAGLSPDARREQHEMHRALYLDQLTEWGELLVSPLSIMDDGVPCAPLFLCCS
jgi:hypothetical protein